MVDSEAQESVPNDWLLSVRPAILASYLKKLLRVKRRPVMVRECVFIVDPLSNFGYRCITKGDYEPELSDALGDILEEGDVFIDVGSNEGYHAILASREVGTSGKIVAIEPQSRLQSIILRNIQENRAYNVTLIQSVVADSEGMATLSLSPDTNTGSSSPHLRTRYRTATEKVPQSTLTGLLKETGVDRVKLMKMDIEGFEWEAILGSRDLFRKGRIQHIALELHPQILAERGKPQQQITDFLESCGYQKNSKYLNSVMSYTGD